MKPVGSIFAAIWTAVVPMLAAAGGAVLLGACASCQSTVRQAAMPAIAAGTFDGVAADPTAQRLYLADGANNKIDVVDLSTANPRFMQAIDVGAVPHGLAVAPDTKLLYAGLTGGAVAVIDTRDGSPTFMKVVTQIKADPTEVDLLDYSAGTKRLFAATGSGGDVVAIDTTSNQVIRWYSLHVPVEQPRYDPVDGPELVLAGRREWDRGHDHPLLQLEHERRLHDGLLPDERHRGELPLGQLVQEQPGLPVRRR